MSQSQRSSAAAAAGGPTLAAPPLGAAAAPAAVALSARGLLDPPLTLDQIRSWRNIPEVVREGMMNLLEYAAGLARTTQAVAIAVNRKAEQEALDSLAGSRVSVDQFTELARFVQRDVLGRLDQPCASHIATNKLLSTLSSKVAQLESLAAAQDATIVALQRELAGKASIEDVEQCITRTGFEAAAAEVTRQVLAEAVEPALRAKADASALQLVVRDLHTLNAEIQTRPTREDAGVLVDSRLHSLRSSLQSSVDACTRSVAEMRSSIEAKAGKDEGVPGAWKAKVASITAAFDGKLEKVRSGVLAEVAARIDPQLVDIVAALNKKAYKSDVAAALAEKVSLSKLDAALAAKADAEDTTHALRRKADGSEVAAVKRALLDLAQSVLTNNNSSGEGAASSVGGSAVAAAGVPPAVITGVQERLATVSSAVEAAAATADAASAGVTAVNTRYNALASEVADLRAQIDGTKARRAQSNVLRGAAAAVSGGEGGKAGAAMQWLGGEVNESVEAEADAAAVAAIQDSLLRLSQSVASKAEWSEVAPAREAASEARARVATLEHAVGVLKAEVDTLRGMLASQTDTMTALVTSKVAAAASAAQPAPASPPPAAAAAASAAAAALGGLSSAITGRWVWKSRYLDVDTARVRWDIESHNTSPEALVWSSPLAGGGGAGRRGLLDADAAARASHGGDADDDDDEEDDPSCSIVTTKPGLYRVALGFFAAAPPGLTLVVDGHPAVSTPAPVAAGGSGSAEALLVGSAVIHRHPAGSVAGVSLVQYLALPAHARLAVLYDGEVLGQGFMEVTKL